MASEVAGVVVRVEEQQENFALQQKHSLLVFMR
jgi:hypothetical protein